ncbi:internal head protein [Pseudomonas phage PhiPA3]|uniref:Virion structural protein n=1 Tax=Pseudomonas phage PhiPA3 TaxID=998086 RepID=F8SJL2_BPPA3|nr:internal head protein [Pseudomonas phage PhiPA3]AEH03522.1 virion structural protein [Pseudomonas phage PhiPA3]
MALEQQPPCNVNDELADTIIEPNDEIIEDSSDFVNVDPEVEVLNDEAEELASVNEALEAYSVLLKQAGEKGINRQTAAIMAVGMRNIDRKLGFDNPGFGLEEFNSATPRDGRQQVVISIEDIKERGKVLFEKLKEFFNKLMAVAKQVWERVAGARVKTERKAQYLLTAIPKFPGYPGGKFRGEVPPVPAGVRSNLPNLADNRKEATDKDSFEVVINTPAPVFADGKNTYDNIDREKRYIKLLSNGLPRFYRDIFVKVREVIRSGNDDSDLMVSILDYVHRAAELVLKTGLAGESLPGNRQLVWDKEALSFALVESDGTVPESITLDLRPNTRLKALAKDIHSFSGEPWTADREKAMKEVSGDYQAVVSDLNRVFADDVERAQRLAGAIMTLMQKVYKPGLFANVEVAVVRALSAKLEIVEAELASY